MRREGRQHGMVRTCLNLPLFPSPDRRAVPKFVSEVTAGLYAKVPSKPTNHSKSTGKWMCHTHPVSKSQTKSKGSQKLKSCDVAKNHRLVAWRVVDKGDDYLDDEVEDCADDVHDDGSPAQTRIGFEEDHDSTDYYDVGFVFQQVEDEDWCVVGEF